MARWWLAIPAACALAGCAQDSPVAPSNTNGPSVEQDLAAFPTPDFSRPSDYYLVGDHEGSKVQVGDELVNFRNAFPRSVKDSRSLDELPTGANADHWTVSGWEDNASRGAGSLLYDGKIAVAMRQYDDVDQKTIDAEVSKYESLFGTPSSSPGNHVSYWFWKVPGAILMICDYKNEKGTRDLTTAIGEPQVMQRLHMSPDAAAADKNIVERIQGPLGKTPNISGDQG
jgi:hypothetical protein